jgi:hypothetical protein
VSPRCDYSKRWLKGRRGPDVRHHQLESLLPFGTLLRFQMPINMDELEGVDVKKRARIEGVVSA